MRISDWSSDVCSSDLFDSVLRLLKGAGLNLHLVIPTVETVADTVRSAAADLPFPALVVEQSAERYAALLAADAALAASGTATLELGLAGGPTVLGYRVNAVTAAIVRRLLSTPYACLGNILTESQRIPEII